MLNDTTPGFCTLEEAAAQLELERSKSSATTPARAAPLTTRPCMPTTKPPPAPAVPLPAPDPSGELAEASGRQGTPPEVDSEASSSTMPPEAPPHGPQLQEEALRLLVSGLSIIPIKTDGSKAPAIQWKDYQSHRATAAQIATWCRKGYGLAVVAGKISGNLEILDFDDPDSFSNWQALVKAAGGEELLKKLPTVITPSGGRHVFYLCKDGVDGNRKLAQKKVKGRPEVLIETRGEGGYVLLPESPPECHPLHQPYVLVRGDLAEIPTISGEERSLLHELAQALNEYVKPSHIVHGGISAMASATGNRPGDQFTARATWEQILEPHGWKKAGNRGEITDWRRPGKKVGISATTNFGGRDLLFVFSSNGDPFEADTGYSKFAAYAFLSHAGDFNTAAADLAKSGYGDTPQLDTPQEWPKPLTADTFYGLAGDIVKTIEPHTEADPAALLLQLCAAFGNVIIKKSGVTLVPLPGKKGPHFVIEADRHGTNLFTVIVGETAKSRKGTSWGHIRRLFEDVDPEWVKGCIESGLSSGEGLIWAVRDPIENTEDQGVSDKRLLVVESEFSSVLKMNKREGNTLSPTVRNAWDTGNLNTLVKNFPAKATDAHISIIGHVTRAELLRYLESTEAANGFGNRFLWGCAQRSKILPEGGKDIDLQPLAKRLKEAVAFAQEAGSAARIKFDEEARQMWHTVYYELSEGKPGLLGAMIARAESQVIRLSCIYALLDCSLIIRREHLKAALAVWKYCEDSCRYIFGSKLEDPVANAILRDLIKSPEGLTRTDINGLLNRNLSKDQIDEALVFLEQHGFIKQGKRDTGGRPAEVWSVV